MIILAADNNLITHTELVRSISEAWPGETIRCFTDPLLCLKYGINHRVDLLITAVRMRGASGQDITRILRQYSPDMRAIYVTDGPALYGVGFEIMPDGIVQRPVTVEKLRTAVEENSRVF